MTPLGIIWLFFGGAFAVVFSALAYDAFTAWWEARKWAERYGKEG
ncbi:hypothetical protein [Thermococcus celericrescens]|nr:hypothetical protein [Thermococcus celericrescens]